ncbi:MAG: bifunctional homocysteine S-methyltransferase/methylenetetrahydrofolate reductase [Acidobacteriota bacterium]
MNGLLEALQRSALLADGAMGSYLFQLTGRLSEEEHVYEALNLDQPELIAEIHIAYLRAGAQCLTTNTFGANPTTLRKLGEYRSAAAVNRAGVRVAREAVARWRERQGGSETIFVLGSVGPVLDRAAVADLRREYEEPLTALLDAGVDALIFETFTSVSDLAELVRFAAELAGRRVPIIAEMTLQRPESGEAWAIEPRRYVDEMRAAGAAVVGLNCCAPWDALAFLDELERSGLAPGPELLLSIMPNAGGFQRIGNRYMTQVNPEFMGRLARTLVRRGVRLVGGCCEVHPEHVREMANFLRSELAGARAVVVEADEVAREELPPVGPDRKAGNGPFSRKLFAGEFVVSVEMMPPRGTSPEVLERKVRLVEEMADSGLVDAVDLTDGSRGIPLAPTADFTTAVRQRLGWVGEGGDRLEFIPHFTCRDLNIMGMQSRLIGFHMLGIHNVLFITGDPPKMAPGYPRSMGVFEADSVQLIRWTHQRLNAGVDFGGQSLGKHEDPRTHFTIGTGFEPEALDLRRELEKLERKLDAGADYIMTQPVFRREALRVLEPYRDRARILVGVMVLRDLAQAERIGQVSGIVLPGFVFERLARFPDPADQRKAAFELAVEQVRWVREQGWPGLYLMSPALPGASLAVLRAAFA